MEISSSSNPKLLELRRKARELGIRVPDHLNIFNSEALTHEIKLLEQLIHERTVQKEELDRLLAECRRQYVSIPENHRLTILQIQNKLDQQYQRYGLQDARIEISVATSLAPLEKFAEEFSESRGAQDAPPHFILEGLFDLAELCTRYCILAYDDEAKELLANSKYRNKAFIDHTGTHTQLVMFDYDGYSFVAFRGTSHLCDAYLDLKFLKTGDPKKHTGFTRAWEAVREEVMAWLRAPRETSTEGVILTGHSLGGALAIAAAPELNQDFNVECVVTIGAPRVGGKQFQANYEELLGNKTWRFEYGTDIITWAVPRWLGYRHVGTRVSIVSGGGFRIQESNYSTAEERNQKRSHIHFWNDTEKGIFRAVDELSMENKEFLRLGLAHWMSLGSTSLLRVAVIYLGFKVLDTGRWLFQRVAKDAGDHGKDEAYLEAIKACVRVLSSQREQSESFNAERREWLRTGRKPETVTVTNPDQFVPGGPER